MSAPPLSDPLGDPFADPLGDRFGEPVVDVGTPLGDELAEGLAGLDPEDIDPEDIDPEDIDPEDIELETTPPPLSSRIICAERNVDMQCGAEIVIGRSPTPDAQPDAQPGIRHMVVDHPLVSRQHVHVRHDGTGLVCTDLGSRNGTHLVRDGVSAPLVAPTTLRSGDRICTLNEVVLFDVCSGP